MKVVYLTPTYYDEESVIGGGERYVHELARHVGKEAEVECISFGAARSSRQRENYRLEIFPAKTSGGFAQGNPWALRWLSRLSLADVIHVHQISTMTGDLATLFGVVRGISVLVTDHGGGGGRILHQRLPWIHRIQAGVAQSAYAADRLIRKGLRRITTIPGGIDHEDFRPCSPHEKRDEIVFVGRLLEHKGPHLLIEAFRMLQSYSGRLRIVGRVYDRTYAEYLRKLAAGCSVTLEHERTDAEVREIVAKARVLVNPAIAPVDHSGEEGVSELMGITVLEALASGTPAIVSSAGALHEIVERTGIGSVFPQGNAAALAGEITNYLSVSPPAPEACVHATRPFGWEKVAEQHLKLYAGG